MGWSGGGAVCVRRGGRVWVRSMENDSQHKTRQATPESQNPKILDSICWSAAGRHGPGHEKKRRIRFFGGGFC